jgi:hypothetical protein
LALRRTTGLMLRAASTLGMRIFGHTSITSSRGLRVAATHFGSNPSLFSGRGLARSRAQDHTAAAAAEAPLLLQDTETAFHGIVERIAARNSGTRITPTDSTEDAILFPGEYPDA